jgi:hypothetical protein
VNALRAAGVAAALYGVAAVGGCTSGPPPVTGRASHAPVAGAGVEPRSDLARRVAVAKDRRYVASYSWTGGGGGGTRTVTVAVALDGTWRVDVPGGALGGQANIALVGRPEAVYQCAAAGCVRVGRSAGSLPPEYDPKVQHAFTDWPGVLTDRGAPLSVAAAKQVGAAAGACFSVEPTSVALAPPIEAGIFCYDEHGVATAVVGRFGTLVLAGAPGPAPQTALLAGPVITGPALGSTAPSPPPSPPPTQAQSPAAPPSPRRSR